MRIYIQEAAYELLVELAIKASEVEITHPDARTTVIFCAKNDPSGIQLTYKMPFRDLHKVFVTESE